MCRSRQVDEHTGHTHPRLLGSDGGGIVGQRPLNGCEVAIAHVPQEPGHGCGGPLPALSAIWPGQDAEIGACSTCNSALCETHQDAGGGMCVRVSDHRRTLCMQPVQPSPAAKRASAIRPFKMLVKCTADGPCDGGKQHS